jgi:hypothetical protein
MHTVGSSPNSSLLDNNAVRKPEAREFAFPLATKKLFKKKEQEDTNKKNEKKIHTANTKSVDISK